MSGLALATLAGSLSMALAATLSAPAIAEPPPADREDALEDTSDVLSTTTTTTDPKRPFALGPHICKPRSYFRVDSLSPRNFFVPRTRFIDGPGGTMTASVTRQHRVYSEIEIEREKGLEITINNLIRRLRNNFNPLLAEEHLVTAGHEFTQEISDGMYGNLWYRVFGYRVGFSAWRELGTCRRLKVTAGIANIPARVEGWRYWETSKPIFHGHVLSPK
ncbi:hypothetical protein [Streptosporangium sp. NPDC000396]|uniref:hypothetical protein n=1 Tax=Streptosporangium sp. NPDC000396 TaxID=3366185 RepID=UPI00369C7539